MCILAGIVHRMAAANHPCSMGQVERHNQLLDQTRCLAENGVELWPEAIVRVQASHNSSINEATGLTPLMLMTGQHGRCPEDSFGDEDFNRIDTTINEEDNDQTRATKLISAKGIAIRRAIVLAKCRIRNNQIKRVDNNRNDEAEQYQVGDLVRRRLSTSERGGLGGTKLAPRYSDLYQVVRVVGQGWTYHLKPIDGSNRRAQTVRHFNDLIPATKRSPGEEEIQQSGDDSVEEEDVFPDGENHDPVTESSGDDNDNYSEAEERERNAENTHMADVPVPRYIPPMLRSGRVSNPVPRLEVGGKGNSYRETRVKFSDTDDDNAR